MRWLVLCLLPLLAGCATCQPLLEVRHCLDEQRVCEPDAWSDDALAVAWDEQRAAAWPDVTALMDATDLGDHAHKKWTVERERAFWDAFGADGPKRELFVAYQDDVYRIRVLTCD